MANSDKNILITPSVGLSTNPTIKFNGANNTPTTLRVLDDGTVSFEGTAGQLFSISDGLSGSIFSVNDISGIPSIEVLDTGLVKLNQYNGSTVFGASAAIQNSSSVNAKVSISTASVSTPGLIIKPVSGQTANLAEFYNGSGVFISGIRHDGLITGQIQSPTIYGGTIVRPNTSSNIPILVRGAASQTGDLQQWQNSAESVMVKISSDGDIYAVSRSVLARFVQADNGAGAYIDLGFNNANSVSIVGRTSTTAPQLIVKGIASQSANLQEWQDSSGASKAYLSINGHFVAQRVYAPDSLYVVSTGGPGTVNIETYANNGIGVIIKGKSSQTADLQQWQNSAGSVVASMSPAGNLTGDHLKASVNFTALIVDRYTDSGPNLAFTSTNILLANRNTASNIVFTVKGMASQTGDLQQWQNSAGTVLASVDAYGTLLSNWKAYIQSGASYLIPLVVKGAASQTANLQEWQNSVGTVLTKINSSGVLTAPAINIVGQSISSNITITSGYRYFVDTTAARTLTLPASPSVGDEIQIFDANNSASTYNITVDSNSAKIEGVVEQYLIDVNGAAVTMTYTGSTFGWKVRS